MWHTFPGDLHCLHGCITEPGLQIETGILAPIRCSCLKKGVFCANVGITTIPEFLFCQSFSGCVSYGVLSLWDGLIVCRGGHQPTAGPASR